MRKSILPIISGLAGIVAAVAPMKSEAATTNWGTPAGNAISFSVTNNDPGTEYS